MIKKLAVFLALCYGFLFACPVMASSKDAALTHPLNEFRVELVNEKGWDIFLDSKNRRVTLPPGNYQLNYTYLIKKDRQGNTWRSPVISANSLTWGQVKTMYCHTGSHLKLNWKLLPNCFRIKSKIVPARNLFIYIKTMI